MARPSPSPEICHTVRLGLATDPKYAKEELIAEFTAAVSCRSLGIVSGVREENAQYLKNWLDVYKRQELYNEYNDINMLNSLIQKNIRYGVIIKDIHINMQTVPILSLIHI